MAADKIRTSRLSRSARLARLGARVGGTYASTAAKKVFASAERRDDLDRARELKTAEAVTAELGQMKGVLMKLGQMASYLDDGLPEPLRVALSQLQSGAPPMSAELAAQVIEEDLGAPPSELFVTWDPDPIAAASIGQVHRAVVNDGDGDVAVAVKVQYPGVAEAMKSDIANIGMLGTLLKQGFGGLEPDEIVAELGERLTEELDYEREAKNQSEFYDYYSGHPFVTVPGVVDTFSSKRVLTTELVAGAPWAELQEWDQDQHNLAAEAIFRFVFRSLYRMKAFNGDPHPGNYLFRPDGQVVFLDFGLVKHFTTAEINMFSDMVQAAVITYDRHEYRRILEDAGMIHANAPIDTDAAWDYFTRFYEPVATDREMTWTPEYASSIVRHIFDPRSPIAQHTTVPRSFVFIQRINLGLYALLGELGATANWRRISQELWPFTNGDPSTPMGEAEAEWLANRPTR